MAEREILERCVNYSLEAIGVYRDLVKDSVGYIIGKQFLRSSTSIGANVNEAQAAQSRADFINKMQISHKEAKETKYWIRLIEGAKLLPKERINGIKDETEQLEKILSTIILRTKKE